MPPTKSSNVSVIIHKAHKLHQQGKFDKAEAFFKKAPENFDALQSLGAIALHKQFYTRAIDLLEKALPVQPNIPGLLNNLALAYKNSGNREKARACFERTVAVDNSFGPAYFNLALFYIDDGILEKAFTTLQEAERCRPGHVPTLTQLAQTLRQLGRFTEAIEYFRYALRLEPDDAQLQFDLGNTYIFNRQLADAVETFQGALRSVPDMHDARAKLADVLESMNRVTEAKTECEMLLASRPDHPLANLVVARMERNNGELLSAKQRLQRIFSGNNFGDAPDDIRAGIFAELGTTLDRLQEYDAAFQAFDRANQIMAELPSTLAIDPRQAVRTVESCLAWANNKTSE